MDLKELRQVIRMLEGTDITELELHRGEGVSVRVTRAVGTPMTMVASQHPVVMTPPPVMRIMEASQEERDEVKEGHLVITSPMVGTFYRSSSPESPPFVQEGDTVKKGQTLCIIEAMKLMNEIEAEVSGQVVRVLKGNASPVEYGEELFHIDPS